MNVSILRFKTYFTSFGGKRKPVDPMHQFSLSPFKKYYKENKKLDAPRYRKNGWTFLGNVNKYNHNLAKLYHC